MLPLLLSLFCAQAPSSARVSLVFGGDVIPHDPVKFVARMHDRLDAAGLSTNHGGWDHVFGPLAPIFKRHDVAVINLETPIVTLAKPEAGEMLFSAPPQMLMGLKQAGVTVATFANNHCLDQHREGIITTREYVQQAGLLTAGAAATEAEAWTPLLLERRGVKIALLAVTRWLNGSSWEATRSRSSRPW
jgi:poly-gamma-glutamate capsule biosynthesis protein CapA/YwtB (metallophosphatase superfamily)